MLSGRLRLWLTVASLSIPLAFLRKLPYQSLPSYQRYFRTGATFKSNQVSLVQDMTTPRAAAISISHGGGPMPVLGDPSQKEITVSLKNRVPEILHLNGPNKPRAIILCTAHWSERRPTINSNAKPNIYYDYAGFGPESYNLKYNAPGSTEVAQEAFQAMQEAGLNPAYDEDRGWDHGVFVPMMLIRPQADIPIVQISVLESEDPKQHFAMGNALAKLRDSNVAFIGSGQASYHNLRSLLTGKTYQPGFKNKNDAWSRTVTSAVLEPDPETRDARFREWRKWPHSYDSHPNRAAEHFLPLIVTAGVGGRGTAKTYKDNFGGHDNWSYYWD